jgi:DNA repair protein RadC
METINLYELKKLQTSFPKQKITSSKTAADFIRKFYSDDIEIFESVFILLLSNSNQTIGYAKISQGGITGTVIDVRLIAKYAVESLAVGIIIAHNHPSGVLKPSQPDLDITKKTKNALSFFDIKVLDHLILTSNEYYSMADNDLI